MGGILVPQATSDLCTVREVLAGGACLLYLDYFPAKIPQNSNDNKDDARAQGRVSTEVRF